MFPVHLFYGCMPHPFITFRSEYALKPWVISFSLKKEKKKNPLVMFVRPPSRRTSRSTKRLWRPTWRSASTRTTSSPQTCKQLLGGKTSTAATMQAPVHSFSFPFCHWNVSVLEAWRSTTAMARLKSPTPWRAGWISWLSRWEQQTADIIRLKRTQF